MDQNHTDRQVVGDVGSSVGPENSESVRDDANRWRTPTVLALCQGIRDSKDFAALPILADALEEANCPHPGLIESCRAPASCPCPGLIPSHHGPPPGWAECLLTLAEVEGGAYGCAALDLAQLAAGTHLTSAQLLAEMERVETGADRLHEALDMNGSNFMYDRYDELWDAYETLTHNVRLGGSESAPHIFDCDCSGALDDWGDGDDDYDRDRDAFCGC